MNDLEKRVAAIERRNRKVEADKAWETSWVRRISITALTYAVVGSFLLATGNDRPLVNALVPAAGFFLSTMVLRHIRTVWEHKDV